MVKRLCRNCGKEFEVYEGLVKKGYGKFCDIKCYGEFKRKRETYEKYGYKVLEVWKEEMRQNSLLVVQKIIGYFYGEACTVC
jgi:hypothetical protein